MARQKLVNGQLTDLTPEEEAARYAEEDADAAYKVSEAHAVELDEEWLRSKMTPIRVLKLLNSICQTIPANRRDDNITQFLDWVANVRQRRQA